jgi:Transglutaminase-like superfamily
VGTPEFYARQDAFTDPGAYAGLYDDLPKSPAELRDIVSQLIIHTAWAKRYGIPPDTPMSRETQTASERLKLGENLLPGSLHAIRAPKQRSFGTCRDYSLMLCSMLRHRAVPARVRCGFATYFPSNPFADHWICEFWSELENRWIQSDAQLDQVQREQFGIGFDPADLPPGAFLTAGRAWQMARAGGADSETFGHGTTTGFRFIRVNVYRDLLTLTGRYTSAWDSWRDDNDTGEALTTAALAAVDSIAGLIGDFEAGTCGLAPLEGMAKANLLPPWPRIVPSRSTMTP